MLVVIMLHKLQTCNSLFEVNAKLLIKCVGYDESVI